jgi:hypothetical protein
MLARGAVAREQDEIHAAIHRFRIRRTAVAVDSRVVTGDEVQELTSHKSSDYF